MRMSAKSWGTLARPVQGTAAGQSTEHRGKVSPTLREAAADVAAVPAPEVGTSQPSLGTRALCRLTSSQPPWGRRCSGVTGPWGAFLLGDGDSESSKHF